MITGEKCMKCNGTGWRPRLDENGEIVYAIWSTEEFKDPVLKPCECQQDIRNEERLKKEGAYERTKNNTFDTYKAYNKETKDAYIKAINFAKNYQGNTILITGRSGSGKTHLADAIMTEIRNKTGLYGITIKYGKLVNDLIESKNFNSTKKANDILDELKTAKILFIDDLFKLDESKENIKYILDIIEYRYEERFTGKYTTILTTEKNYKELLKLDEALASRILEMAKLGIIQLNTHNYRLNNQGQNG